MSDRDSGAAHQFELAPSFDELAQVATEIRRLLVGQGVGARAVQAVDLALEELVGNTIRHGCGGGTTHHIEIQVWHAPQSLRLEIRDDARPFDPTVQPPPPPHRSVAEARVGGQGIVMVRRFIPDMRYRHDGRLNILELVLDPAA